MTKERWAAPAPLTAHFISCSRLSNSGLSKKSLMEIPSPSHITFSVTIFGFWLFPYSMFLTEDGGNPARVARALTVISRSAQRLSMRFLIALHNGDCIGINAYTSQIRLSAYMIIHFLRDYRLHIPPLGYT